MNRDRQIEMEQVATHHLKEIGALVSPPFLDVDFSETKFEIEASVIIPVLNREKTIADAIRSVLDQQTKFPFNLIVIDNHSTDKTAEIIQSYGDERIIHMIPERNDLGIGGCWNDGVNHPQCGRFAIQLDSDDLYSDGTTLQKIVDKFYEQRCAMVIGSYQMVNFKLEEIPPGIIDHREWSDDNGSNNALRINGLGAPRAFYTPIIRQIGFPNVSYGEDYAVAIAISGNWKVGRIYEPVYLCRRWDNNTDSNLSIEKTNAHNRYKDSLRSAEIDKRKESLENSH
jgi:glycosyltransferase involved in cell wall biosynthesis